MSGLGVIDVNSPSDLMELDKPTAAPRVARLLGMAVHLHRRNEGGDLGPKLSQSLLEHVFVLPGTGPSQGQRIGGRPTSKKNTEQSTRFNSRGSRAYSVDTD